ncbi:hypothetical protein K3495_g7974 [Podosphaera aphanis]|nr:hypothetical protein K3495_g7974 [Podosphaera aphanis]
MKFYSSIVALLFLWLCDAKINQKFHSHFHSHVNLLEIRHGHEKSNATDQATDGGDSTSPRHPHHDEVPSNHTAHSGLQEDHGTCSFPTDAGLVSITPGSKNAGWAMSPDQACSPGSYCPYACPSGQVMAQWNPDAKSYTYPQSMDGGLYCDHDGQVKKPFPEKPYCESGTGVVGAQNKVGKGVSFCQTVLPGNEAMLIPTHVIDSADLAVPGTNYWCNTAAHYYINPPGVKAEEACVWGDESKPIGNWSPFVAGANTDQTGRTFVKIGWNPIYTGSSLAKTPPKFGVKIVCENEGCDGAPCSIDPSSNGVGGVLSATQATGAGGANFCVVTVPKGSKANIEVFNSGGSDIEPPSKSPDENKKNPPSNSPSDKPKEDPNHSPDKKPDHSISSNPDEKHEKPSSSSSSISAQKAEKPSTVNPSENTLEAQTLSEEKPDHSQTNQPEEKNERPSPSPGHPSPALFSSEVDKGHEESSTDSSTPVTEANSSVEPDGNSSNISKPSSEESSVNSQDLGSPNKNVHHHQTVKDESDSTSENAKTSESSHATGHYAAHSNSQYSESEGSVTLEPLRSRSVFGFIILFAAANYIL